MSCITSRFPRHLLIFKNFTLVVVVIGGCVVDGVVFCVVVSGGWVGLEGLLMITGFVVGLSLVEKDWISSSLLPIEDWQFSNV